MSLRALSTAAMVSVSSAWVDPARDRPLFQSFTTLAGLLPRLDTAHANLVATQPSAGVPPELAGIQKQEADADALHDRKLRGMHHLLTGLANLADDAGQARAFADLRDHLFPDGLEMTQASYAIESGATQMIDARLTPQDQGYLRSTPVLGGALLDQVNAWKAAGNTLGDLERQRSQLPESTGISKAKSNQARNGWIAVVNAIVANAALEPTLNEAKHLQLFGLLDRLTAAADRRHGPEDAEHPPAEGTPAQAAAAKPASGGK